MRRARLAVAALVVAAGVGPVSPSGSACANEGRAAALVVDTGADGGVHRYCVAFSDDAVTGLELIRLAGEQHGLAYKLGYGGEAVCMLAGVGPTGDDCFEDYPTFWGYWRGDGHGGWTWASSGAGSSAVEPGDVEGWSWGEGTDGDSHPRPPPTDYGDACAVIVGSRTGESDRRESQSAGRERAHDVSPDDPPVTESASPAPARQPPQRDLRPRRLQPPQRRARGGGFRAGKPISTPVALVPRSETEGGTWWVGLAGLAGLLAWGLVLRRRKPPS